jgi:type II secretory pathway pseudopilin PulG
MRRRPQSGYVLLVILFMLFVFALGITAAAQRIRTQIRRDREAEMIHRGQQYQRAVGRYYRKFGRYPLSIEQLEDTNHVRFLRRRYKDPTAVDGQWKVLHVGEAKNPPLGLFGQKLTVGSGLGGSSLGTSTVGGQAPAQNPFGGLSGNPASGGAPANPQSPTSTDNSGNTNPTSGAGGSSGGQQLPGSGPESLGKGRTLGGGPVIGVVSLSPRESLKEYQGKSHYNQWEFVYDPIADQAKNLQRGLPQGGQVGTPVGQPQSGPNPPANPNPDPTRP